MDYEDKMQGIYAIPVLDSLDCRVCGSPHGEDVFYHVNGNFEGVDSVCNDCERWFVRLMIGDDNV